MEMIECNVNACVSVYLQSEVSVLRRLLSIFVSEEGDLCCYEVSHCFSLFFLARCLPGYPFKCPKLKITPEMGLSQTDANKLLSLLLDQVLACSFGINYCFTVNS